MAKTWGHESDGGAIDVTLAHTVTGDVPVLVDGFAGFIESSGDSGEVRGLITDGRVYRVQVPSGLSVSIGDTIHVTVASVTEHEIPDGAYTTTSGAGTVPFLRVLSEKDGNNYLTAKLVNMNGEG